MTDEGQTPITVESFAKWLDRFEHDSDAQNAQIGQLTASLVDLKGIVGGLAATVQSLVNNQEGLFKRQNRPYPWGAVIGGLTLIGLCAGLLVAPVQKELDRQHEFDVTVMRHIEADAFTMGQQSKDIEWLKKMEDRLNNSIHKRIEVPYEAR